MRRREFIAVAGAAVASAWPSALRAQQPAVPVVGALFARSPSERVKASLRKGLSEMGFVEGRNIAIEFRFAENDIDKLREFAAEFVRRSVGAIYAGGGTFAVAAAKAATTAIPIVFSIGDDPEQTGLVPRLNRPGGNVTGISFVNAALAAKRIGLLHELVPAAERLAMLVDPSNRRTAAAVTADAKKAAATINRSIEVFTARSAPEVESAFAAMAQKRVQGLVFGPGSLFGGRVALIATLAARHALPAMHFSREFVEAGGLMSYGSSIADANRQAGIYIGRILKGEKPAELPVMQAAIRHRR
jgi:putative ABC transport system substrate-binding protein